LTGKILTNGYLKKFDRKIFDEFHKINAHILLTASVAKKLTGKKSVALIDVMAQLC